MLMRPRLRPPLLSLLTVALGLLTFVAAPPDVRAQGKGADHYGLVILNDGTVLQGRVNREDVATDQDPVTGTPFSYPKGFFLVDDGPRRIYFSPKQVRVVTPMDEPKDDQVNCSQKPVFGPKMQPIAEVVDEGPWALRQDLKNAFMERDFTFRATPNGPPLKLTQRIAFLTPNFVRVDSVTKVEWRSVYLPRELQEDAIRKAVNNHPDFQEQPGMTEAARIGQRLRYADFFTRTGLYDIAKEELDRILRDFPGQKERVVERQKAIARLGAREDFERLKRLHLGGRYKEVHDRLFDEKNKFPMDDLPDDTLASFRELKAEYEGVKERSDRAVKYLAELAPQVETQYREMFTEAAKSIKDDVYYENLARLDTFLSQAKQAEKQVKAGKKPDLNPSDLMGLAITGWLLGNGAAEANPAVAAKLWRTRQMLVEYLHTASGADRKKLLEKYLAERQDSTALDDITRIIPTLPPIEPEAKITEKTVEVQLGRNNRGPTYALKLPPDYRHSRPYPVLIVLHKEGEKPGAMIDKWKDQAAENGYILAAPEWETRNNLGLYTYGDNNEHEAVLETVRDLRRRFQVDSDRVFLFGQGQGANMAHDVALSHPDLFAGVSSMGVNPEYHALHYWRNGQYLPFYMVTGTSSGKAEENVHKLFENWVSGGNRPAHSYPMLWVQYKNRGADWFGGEVVNLFDWMRAKRRAFPLHQLGTDGLGEAFGDEFFTVRATDNHFYWLSTDNLDANNLIPSFTKWRKLPRAPRMTAIVDRPKNEIRVAEQGLKQITIWLGRNAKGESMVDFDKPVMIRINGTAPTAKTLTPSATVLLEDLYNRGDRQRLFLAKVEIGQ